MKQLALPLLTVLEVEGEQVQLTPSQASWMDAQRHHHRADPRRRPDCTGCRLFGLCALHDSAAPDEDEEIPE